MRKYIAAMIQEIRYILKTPPALLVLCAAPLLYPFLYNVPYVNKFETKIPVVVIDLDHSVQSREFIRKIGTTEQVALCGVQQDLAAARKLIETNAVQGVFIIPENFERDLLIHKRPVIRAFANNTRFMPAVDVGKGLTEAIVATSKDQLLATFMQAGISRNVAKQWVQPISLRSEGLGNTVESYGDFIIPALLLLILQQTLFVGTAITSAGMGRHGRRLPKETNIVTGLLARATPYLALYIVYAVVFFTVQYRIWQIPFNGNLLALATLVLLHLVVTILFGFLVGLFCKSHLTAMILTMFSSYPFFLLSGLAWPPESMPLFLQVARNCLPSTHFFPIAMNCARLQATVQDILPHIFSLLAILFVLTSATLLRMGALKKGA